MTVLYPFVAPDRIDGAIVSKLQELLAPCHPFNFQLVRTAWFGDHSVLGWPPTRLNRSPARSRAR